MFDFSSDQQFASAAARVVSLRRERTSLQARQRDIYESHRHRTFSLAYYMTGNELEAEKILAGTFVTAFREAEEPSGHQVDLALVQQLQRRFHLGSSETTPPALPSSAGPGLYGQNVRRTDLEEAIQELPVSERLLFLLRDVEGYTSAAIADLLRIPEPQVMRMLFTARIRLRQALAAFQNGEEKAA